MDGVVPNDPPESAMSDSVMDAATRAELEELRRRAYGPNESALAAPEAARLRDLEHILRADASAQPPAPEPTSATSAPPAPPTAPAPTRRRTAGLVAGSLVAVAAVAVVASPWLNAPADLNESAPEAVPTASPAMRYAFPADPHTESLLEVRLDGSFGNYIDLPTTAATPMFPTSDTLEWISPLGEYYGWNLWIASSGGDDDDEHCILIERDDDVRSRCVNVGDKPLGTLRVSLAGSDIDSDEQPRVMADDQRVRFWWHRTGIVDVVLGSFLGR